MRKFLSRKILSLVVLAGASMMAQSQPPAQPVVGVPPVRYGITVSPDAFPQNNPKTALSSVIRAIEKGKADYLAAHLLDPKFIDARVAERAAEYIVPAERDLRALRDLQRTDPNLPRFRRVPDDPVGFSRAVAEEAQNRAFRVVVKDIADNMAENPERVRDLAKFLRDGQLTPNEDDAKFSLKDVKDREVFLKKIGTRWFVEDRQQEPVAAPMPPPKN